MTLLTRTNGSNLDSIFNNRINGDFYLTPRGFYSGEKSIPAVNIYENANEFKIELAAPGLAKEDFAIDLNHGKLVVSANKQNLKASDSLKVVTREFNYGSFRKEFTVSRQKIDESQISAQYENGILNILLPKREEIKQKPKLSITIN